jgi:hypothetical protein
MYELITAQDDPKSSSRIDAKANLARVSDVAPGIALPLARVRAFTGRH